MNHLLLSDNNMGDEAAYVPEQPAPRETSDPVEILARREIEIGINLRGIPLDRNTRLRIALELNITID